MQASIIHYVKKIHQYGLLTSTRIVKDRITKKLFDRYWRTRARYKKASHSWAAIQKKYAVSVSFQEFLSQVKEKESHFIKQAIAEGHKQHESIISQADLYTQQCFALLGARPACYLKMPWHHDFRLSQQDNAADYHYDGQAYYKDIHIRAGSNEQLSKDIKIPWELSRLQHFFTLGQAYLMTNDNSYADAFVRQYTDWHTQNPFLLGPAWMCPMDVGLRAVNLVIAFHLFKKCSTISNDFWQTYVCTLYDHLFYLEHNWEVYDYKTSNHYLSDLIGYYYLCSFFSTITGIQEKLIWCHQELLREWDKQIFDEGTDYEGSTCYHRLITELFHHMLLVSTDEHLTVPSKYLAQCNRMIEFIQWCTPEKGALIQIGDNDSGTIVQGLPSYLFSNNAMFENIKQYKQFGLSIIKSKEWHISLRHHAYQAKQPSGHFHNDAGSITVSYQGIPIFVDPGSYIYTPSAFWRNHFRSVHVHNTMYLENEEPVPFDERLFALMLPEREYTSINHDKNIVSTSHDLYQRFGLQLNRKIELDELNQQIVMNDSWSCADQKKIENRYLCWNFTLGHQIKAFKNGSNIVLYYDTRKLVSISSTLEFEIVPGWLSLDYGKKIATKRLQAKCSLSTSGEVTITVKDLQLTLF